ncbi:MAG: hypothetical protein LBT51_09650 [Fusobacteriaceae bacterium]|jgi:hypothetical protein|nr:hypothetical protein [Fusobacteriaceae bacterium]
MNLKIINNDKNYKYDSIGFGRSTKEFLTGLSKNIFEQSYQFYNDGSEVVRYDLPILISENKLYSTFAVALDKLIHVHQSEVHLKSSIIKYKKEPRSVDF